MKFGRARHAGQISTFRVVDPDCLLLLDAAAPSPDMCVRDPAAMAVLASASGREVAIGDVELLAPVGQFNRDILCTGWNYWDHYQESAGKRQGQDPVSRPEYPTFFTKGPDTVVGPNAQVPIDLRLSDTWDYEAELALVIGRDGRSIPVAHALDHIAGYCLANDVSVREFQRRHGGQWLKGKSIDGSLVLGPWITTPDELTDVQDLDITFELNGQRLQQASTAQMAFPIAHLIFELSLGMTLRAGDVLITGTPAGIGSARQPQIFLRPGDQMVTDVSGLGRLENTVVERDLASYWVP